jgi:aryl-alcohol dehydrogenase-like predicted oxidoreductase
LACQSRRPQKWLLIATKVGWEGGLSAANIENRVNGSLKRLRVDCIDLLYGHRDDQNTPIEETLEAFERLVRAEKVRTLGASSYSGFRLETATRVAEKLHLTGFSVLQSNYNLLYRRELEGDLLAAARQRKRTCRLSPACRRPSRAIMNTSATVP